MTQSNFRNLDLSLFLVMEQLWLTRSVSETGQRLNFAQSTVSMALKRLRTHFDDELFVWNGHVMVPTTRTEELIPEIRDLVSRIQGLLEAATDGFHAQRRKFVIATADYIAELIGPGLIGRIQDQAPQFSLDFVEVKPQLLQKSSLPDVDLFLLPRNSFPVTDLLKAPLYKDTYTCIARVGHGSAGPKMSAKAFSELPFVGYTALPRAIISHEALFWQQQNIFPEYVLTSTSYCTFASIVSRSDAVAIIPSRLAQLAVNAYPVKSFAPPIACPPLELMQFWRPEQDADAGHAWLRAAIKAVSQDLLQIATDITDEAGTPGGCD